MRLRPVLGSLVLCFTLALAGVLPAQAAPGQNYAPDDPFTSARTQWWRDGHFGMFMHFGLYSAYRGEYRRPDGTVCRNAEWIKRDCAIPWTEYEAKAATFNPSGFDANAVIGAAKAAGQKYFVITTKHHDGFAMWPTKVNNWNIYDRTPFKRDILAELATAARAQGVKLGFYYSIWDWHDPDAQPGSTNYAAYVTRMKAQLKELLTNYGDIAELWFDGEWEAPWTDQEGARLEDFVRGLAPNTIINNRVGSRGIADGDFGTPEQEVPATPTDGQLWESCMTINDHWGFAAYDTNYKSATTLVRHLAGIAASSGNYLLNVGPDERGVIPQPQIDRLTAVGNWLRTNGPAVYSAGYTGLVTKPSWGVVSRNGNKLYASVYNWPASGAALHLTAKSPFTVTGARVLTGGAAVPVTPSGDGYDLRPTGPAPDPIASVIELDITPAAARPPGSGTGLIAQFWANNNFSGAPAVTRVDATVNANWHYEGSPAPPIPTTNFSARWTGQIEPRYSQTYTFATLSDDTVRLWINGQLVIDDTTPHGPKVDKGTIALTAGQRYPITMEVTQNGGESAAKLFWSSPDTPQQIVPATQLYPSGQVTTLNDDAPGMTYTGTWQPSTGRSYAADYNNDVHYTTTNGDAFSYTFTGTGIDFRSEKYSDQGLVDFYLDGALQATVDTANPTRLSQQLLYSRRGLPLAQHTLRAVKRSGTYMLVDRIDIYP
ncbi:alpha-L-fucosidase [Sphaerisporangium album]|uniref:alpha-L-fucosidase n=1 Tax=Sphaerisporangium album TaxID=509200 RepID=A0A367FSR3_9ACTN|nr:alpha-L-fucosidase [Sphaerisporangium album]RCG32832.1 alpha-L-fucosidase [Sphaerisporangium album]